MVTTVYTDGACIGNPGPGGWAWAVPEGGFASGAEAKTTNQRMELTAVVEALRALPGPLLVISDSTYVVNCYRQRWYVAWEANGWRTKSGPVANRDLWEPIVEQFHVRGADLELRWVKGHSGDAMNDVVDRLAVEAATAQVGRHGDAPPSELGPADKPRGSSMPGSSTGGAVAGSSASAAAARGQRTPGGQRGPGGQGSSGGMAARGGRRSSGGPAAPDGHRAVVFGHRPDALGGYDDNPIAERVRDRLTEILAGLRAVNSDLVVLTGLGLGAEQLAAEAAVAAGVPYVAVLAFPGQETVWPKTRQAAYRQLLDAAANTITLSATPPPDRTQAGKLLGQRTTWMASHADAAIVVWDGKDPGLGATVRTLRKHLDDDVWIVPPPEA